MPKLQKNKQQVVTRLNRIAGQVQGVKRMIEQGRSCEDVIAQMAAVRAAMGQVTAKVVELYMQTCLQDLVSHKESGLTRQAIEKLFKQVLK